MMTSQRYSRIGRALALATTVLASASCAGPLATASKSPSLLIIDILQGASGATPGTLGNPVLSDVVTLVPKVTGNPTIFNDLGQVVLRAALKNPGTPATPTTPTALNAITVTRYHVKFRRADGQERQGIDVPFEFDGGLTATVSGATTLGFELVHSSMKLEPPLLNMRNGGGAILISTIAEVTFYGHDQAGNDVSVMGMITVNFGDFGDP